MGGFLIRRPPKEEFVAAWYDENMTRIDIAQKFGLTKGTTRRIAIEFGLPLERQSNYIDTRRTDDPTPEEIAERAAEVRRSWSSLKTEKRSRPLGKMMR